MRHRYPGSSALRASTTGLCRSDPCRGPLRDRQAVHPCGIGRRGCPPPAPHLRDRLRWIPQMREGALCAVRLVRQYSAPGRREAPRRGAFFVARWSEGRSPDDPGKAIGSLSSRPRQGVARNGGSVEGATPCRGRIYKTYRRRPGVIGWGRALSDESDESDKSDAQPQPSSVLPLALSPAPPSPALALQPVPLPGSGAPPDLPAERAKGSRHHNGMPDPARDPRSIATGRAATAAMTCGKVSVLTSTPPGCRTSSPPPSATHKGSLSFASADPRVIGATPLDPRLWSGHPGGVQPRPRSLDRQRIPWQRSLPGGAGSR